MKDDIKNHSVCVRITKEENDMVESLRNDHCVNMSKFIRKFIRDTYMELKNKNEKNEKR